MEQNDHEHDNNTAEDHQVLNNCNDKLIQSFLENNDQEKDQDATQRLAQLLTLGNFSIQTPIHVQQQHVCPQTQQQLIKPIILQEQQQIVQHTQQHHSSIQQPVICSLSSQQHQELLSLLPQESNAENVNKFDSKLVISTFAKNQKRKRSMVWNFFKLSDDCKTVVCRCGMKYKWGDRNGTSTLKHHINTCRDCVEHGKIGDAIAHNQRGLDEINAALENEIELEKTNSQSQTKPKKTSNSLRKKKSHNIINMSREDVAKLGTFKLKVFFYPDNIFYTPQNHNDKSAKYEHTLREMKTIDQVRRFLEHIYGTFNSFECKDGDVSIAADELLYADKEYTCKCVLKPQQSVSTNERVTDNQHESNNNLNRSLSSSPQQHVSNNRAAMYSYNNSSNSTEPTTLNYNHEIQNSNANYDDNRHNQSTTSNNGYMSNTDYNHNQHQQNNSSISYDTLL